MKIELVVTYNHYIHKYNCPTIKDAYKIMDSYIGKPMTPDFKCEMNLSDLTEDDMNVWSRFQKEQIIEKRIKDLEKDFE